MPSRVDDFTLQRWMESVVDRAWHGVAKGQSPFAAAIYAADGAQLSLECNTVARTNQPSRHAEVKAIDAACRELGRPTLKEVWLVSSGEPCPMCAATAAMAGIRHIAFGATEKFIAKVGYQTLGIGCEQFFSQANLKVTLVGGVNSSACERLLAENPPD